MLVCFENKWQDINADNELYGRKRKGDAATLAANLKSRAELAVGVLCKRIRRMSPKRAFLGKNWYESTDDLISIKVRMIGKICYNPVEQTWLLKEHKKNSRRSIT